MASRLVWWTWSQAQSRLSLDKQHCLFKPNVWSPPLYMGLSGNHGSFLIPKISSPYLSIVGIHSAFPSPTFDSCSQVGMSLWLLIWFATWWNKDALVLTLLIHNTHPWTQPCRSFFFEESTGHTLHEKSIGDNKINRGLKVQKILILYLLLLIPSQRVSWSHN